MRPLTRRPLALIALAALVVLAPAGCRRAPAERPSPPAAMRVVAVPSSIDASRLAAYERWSGVPIADRELPFSFCPTDTLGRGILGAFVLPDSPRLRGGDHNVRRAVVYERGLTVTQLSFGRPPEWTAYLEQPELIPAEQRDPAIMSRQVYRLGSRRVLGTAYVRWDRAKQRSVFDRSEVRWSEGAESMWYEVEGVGVPLESLLHVVQSMTPDAE